MLLSQHVLLQKKLQELLLTHLWKLASLQKNLQELLATLLSIPSWLQCKLISTRMKQTPTLQNFLCTTELLQKKFQEQTVMHPLMLLSLPFKLMVFVLMDGWQLLVVGMVGGFA